MNFPGGPVDESLSAKADRGQGFDSWSGKFALAAGTDSAAQLLSQHALEPVLHNKRKPSQ